VFCQTYEIIVFEPSQYTIPNSINEQGEIAGYYTDVITDKPYGFVRAADGTNYVVRRGRPFHICFQHQRGGSGYGYFFAPPFRNPEVLQSHGFVRDPFGNFTTFDPPGSINTQALNINAGGDVYRLLRRVE
jgi:hypothetical protein